MLSICICTDRPKKLERSFYDRKNVVLIAKELLGKILVTQFNGIRCSGRIVETEAYAGVDDRASHAFGGRRTTRSEHLYGAPGTVYVYISYGMHHLFNVITNKQDIPHGVLIRALEPMDGIRQMLLNSGKPVADYYTYQRTRQSCACNGNVQITIRAEIYFQMKFLLRTTVYAIKKTRSLLQKESE